MINTIPENADTNKKISKVGTNYPVYFGITQVHRLREKSWASNDINLCIDLFVKKIFANTEVAEKLVSLDSYHDDVYTVRDDIIMNMASRNNLQVLSNTDKNEDFKFERTFTLDHNVRLVGGLAMSFIPETHSTFWDNPPEIVIKSRPPRKKITHEIDDETKDIEEIDTNPFGFLDTRSQALFKRNVIKDFSKENIRTFSDRNQLSRQVIITYLAYLADKNKITFFTVALLRAALGIEQMRLFDPQKNKDHKDWVIKFHDNNTISYLVSNGATDFAREKGKGATKAAHVTVRLPATLYELLKTVFNNQDSKIDQSGVQKTFKLKQAGSVPTLNRITRSAHIIYRLKHLDENACFVLSGNIPVYRRASNSYIATENTHLATNFLKILNDIIQDVSEVTDNVLVAKIKHDTTVLLAHKGLEFQRYLVGSQLAAQAPFDFYAGCINHLSTLNLSSIDSRANQVEKALQILSQHETYFYFLLQFSNAGRAVGPNTILKEADGYTLYREKSSRHYSEHKFLNTLKLVTQQLDQLIQMRQNVYLFVQTLGYLIPAFVETALPLKYEVNYKKEIIKTDTLNGKSAHKIASNWGYKPLFQRTNAPRHQCASSIQNFSHEEAVRDVWVGHHIDGFAPTSPNSSGNPRYILESLDTFREQFIIKNSFQLLKSENLYGAT
ncbi:hypothetical protein [Oleiphilus sp. HI0117]|uniref:hypothetical protein n=2 Tax=unclassified Oleiphilus TaxID=2631174 RepID=UPI0012E849C6|nr:hypothetical protein [Oleiphilus sp. HI0117]